MGLEVESSNGGCCGMAGAWGYETAHYDVSIACGERVLFPAVRRGDDDALVVTDGFSCRTQIEQGDGPARAPPRRGAAARARHARRGAAADGVRRALARAGALVAGAAAVVGGVLALRDR